MEHFAALSHNLRISFFLGCFHILYSTESLHYKTKPGLIGPYVKDFVWQKKALQYSRWILCISRLYLTSRDTQCDQTDKAPDLWEGI